MASEDHAAQQIWRELVESSVECELCNEPYDDDDGEDHLPRLLSCGHTFCQSCLEDWSSVGASAGLNALAASAYGSDGASRGGADPPLAMMDCPTCRRTTSFHALEGPRSLPKNFELLRVRQEIEAHTQQQLEKLKQVWTTQVLAKERLAQEAEEHAMLAQRESVQAAQRALHLAKQVEINEQEKVRAQELAQEARRKALVASQQAEALQAETELLKQRLHQEALQLQRVQSDATSAAAEAAQLHSRAEALQQQVDHVRAQLSLHAGRHDPSKLVVLVVEPTTVGSWLLPYTRYAVISIASSDAQQNSGHLHNAMDPYQAAKTWTRVRHVAEPSSSVKVYRRYSDFVWLHHELHRRFPFELVPSIPGKQLFFNKDKEFVGERMRALQAFVREILRHPVLALTEDVRAFLLSTTEELENLRNASRMSADDDSFLLEVEESEAGSKSRNGSLRTTPTTTPSSSVTENHSTSAVPPPAPRSSWAWGAVSAITSGAAKLVTSTGSALTSSISGVATVSGAGSEDATERSMSSSLTSADDVEHGESGGATAAGQCVEKRRKYIEIAQAHHTTTQKGSDLSRAQRNYSHHLHRLCELMHDMDALDQSYIKKRRDRVATSMERSTYTARQVEEDARSCLESRTFQAKASETFSAFSLSTKNDAECMEYALLEISRMQSLHLGAVEDAFRRLRAKEDVLQRATASAVNSGVSSLSMAVGTASAPSSLTSDGFGESPASPVLASKHEELLLRRQELVAKVDAIDPSRSAFVLETLQQNVVEMHKLAQARRKMDEASYQQLLAARRGP